MSCCRCTLQNQRSVLGEAPGNGAASVRTSHLSQPLQSTAGRRYLVVFTLQYFVNGLPGLHATYSSCLLRFSQLISTRGISAQTECVSVCWFNRAGACQLQARPTWTTALFSLYVRGLLPLTLVFSQIALSGVFARPIFHPSR